MPGFVVGDGAIPLVEESWTLLAVDLDVGEMPLHLAVAAVDEAVPFEAVDLAVDEQPVVAVAVH